MKLTLSSGKEIGIFISHYHDHNVKPGVEHWFPRTFKGSEEPVFVQKINDSTDVCIKIEDSCFYATSFRHPKDREFNKKLGRKFAMSKVLSNQGINWYLDKQDKRDIWNFILGRK